MRIEIVMPRLSDSMSEGSVTAWFKNEGDDVVEGEAIAEIETEKSTVDLAAPSSGVLARIAVAAGSGPVAVGTLLAEMETEKAAAKRPAVVPSQAQRARAARPAAALGKSAARRPPDDEPALVPTKPASAADKSKADRSIAATPLARRMAAQAGLSLADLTRSGIGGKVCKADVEAALGRTTPLSVVSSRAASSVLASRGMAAASARATGTGMRPAPPVSVSIDGAADGAAPMSRMRRTIAERMTRSKATIPHFYLSVGCRVDRLLDVRARLKGDGLAISMNDFVVRATAIALVRVPEANASWIDGAGIVRHDQVDIAVAVALDDGLVTPVLRSVDAMGLSSIGAAVRELAARAREGALAPQEYDGATFTISNLGMHGVREMFAIINPPQACILGVGAAEAVPVVEDGKVVAGTVMTLSLSADHRVLDGTTGARLLGEIRRLLEEPALMLV
ncbi:MAG: dihydrolipoamide acetyltransferase family protein [Candidatus Binatia bacterium]